VAAAVALTAASENVLAAAAQLQRTAFAAAAQLQRLRAVAAAVAAAAVAVAAAVSAAAAASAAERWQRLWLRQTQAHIGGSALRRLL
jgi:hypothetical protein